MKMKREMIGKKKVVERRKKRKIVMMNGTMFHIHQMKKF
jgi:hypothetical protein